MKHLILLVTLGVLLLTSLASAALYDHFENAGDTNGIDSSRWSTIDSNWNREILAFGTNPIVARSHAGDETAMGNLESNPIPLSGNNALRLKHAGFHGGNGPDSTFRNKFYAGPLNQNRIEIWGANASGITSPQPLIQMVAQSDPLQTALVDLIDESFSHVVVRGVDNYCDGVTVTCDGGFGWLAIDDVQTTFIENRLLAPNGNFEDTSMANWDFSLANGAWGFGTGAGENRQSAFEGGRMAGSLLPDTAGDADEMATGRISSVGWTVLDGVLKFQSQGFDGTFNNQNIDDGVVRNFVEIRNGGGAVLETIPGPDDDDWVENEVDLFNLGLNLNDPFSVRIVDGADNFRVAWMGVDYFRFTDGGIFVPPETTFTWNSSTLADWNVGGNWTPTGGPPRSTRHTAVFSDVITANHTVVTNLPLTVNRINFDNASHMYAIGGTGSINLAARTGALAANPSIHVLAGSHQFQAVVNLLGDTTANVVDNGSTLSFNNELNLMGNTLTKTGAGAVEINNKLTTAGGVVSVQEGVVAGHGTIGGDVVNNGGTIAPGDLSSGGNLSVPEPSAWILVLAGFLAICVLGGWGRTK